MKVIKVGQETLKIKGERNQLCCYCGYFRLLSISVPGFSLVHCMSMLVSMLSTISLLAGEVACFDYFQLLSGNALGSLQTTLRPPKG